MCIICLICDSSMAPELAENDGIKFTAQYKVKQLQIMAGQKF